MRRWLSLLFLLALPATASGQTTWGFTELDLLPLGGVTAPVRFFDLSGHAFTIQAPTAVTAYSCTWPGAIGSANQTLSISTVSPCALAWTSSGAGNVTHTGTLTANAFILGNGGADIIAASPITGLVLGHGASAPTAYAGTIACSAGDFIKSLDGSGVATCATPAGSGTVTTTGSPASGNLTQFSGATSITNGDLSGDVSTSGTLVTTIGANKVTLAKLATQANNTILANISGGTAVPTAATLTAIIDSAIGAVQGDILYRNATVWTVLAPGTSGQVLTTQGAAANPIWATPGGGTVTGSGTTNLLAIWTSSSAIGAFSNGTGLLHAGTPPTWSLVNLSAGGDVVNVLTVPNGGLGLASGTTGGIPYFTSAVTIASSPALVNHAVVVGGGSAQAPHTIATGTSGQLLVSQGSGTDPVFTAPTSVCAAGLNTVCASQFGVTVGGSAATNVTGLKAAIAAVSPTGGKLIIDMAGTVDLNGDIPIGSGESVTQPNRSIEIECFHGTFNGFGGVFNGTILNNTRTSGTTFSISSEAAVIVRGCGFATGSAGSPGSLTPVSGAAIVLSAPSTMNTGSRFYDNNFANSWVGLDVQRAINLIISGNFFGPTQFAGIELRNDYNDDFGDTRIINNFFDSSSATIPSQGHVLHTGSGATHIAYNGFSNAPQAYLMDRKKGSCVSGCAGSGGNSSDLVIAHNRMEGQTNGAVIFSRSAVANLVSFSNIQIHDNEVEMNNASESAFNVLVAASGPTDAYLNMLQITGNIVEGNGTGLAVNLGAPINGTTMVSNNIGSGLGIAVQALVAVNGIASGNNLNGTTPFSISTGSGFRIIDQSPVSFAALTTNMSSAADGSQMYCTNCAQVNPCLGAGSGAFAKRINGAWVCN